MATYRMAQFIRVLILLYVECKATQQHYKQKMDYRARCNNWEKLNNNNYIIIG